MQVKKIHVSFILSMIFLTIITLTIVFAISANNKKIDDQKTDRYIVQMRDGQKFESFSANASKNIKSIKSLKHKGDKQIILMTLTDKTDKKAFVNEVKSGKSNDYIDYIVPDDQVSVASSDPLFDQQWPIYTTQTSNY